MAIINVPAKFSFTAVSKFTLDRASLSARARYTGKGWYSELPYAVWVIDATLVEYDGQEAAYIRSFFAKLKGRVNTFRLPVPGYVKPSSNYAGTTTLKTAALARATAITVTGGVANAVYLKEGEYFTINDELKIVTQDVNLNASGECVINFEPGLRADAIVGALIITTNPTILMRSSKDDIANWGISAPYRHKLKLEAEEAI